MYDDQWQDNQDDGYGDDHPNEEATPQQMLMGLAGGLVGAGIGAAIWIGLALGMGVESGMVALGIGWLTGFGVAQGAKFAGAENQLYVAPAPYQIAAASLAFLSYATAKFIIVTVIVSGSLFGIFDFGGLPTFISAFFQTLGFWDLLWMCIMMWMAWSAPNLNSAD